MKLRHLLCACAVAVVSATGCAPLPAQSKPHVIDRGNVKDLFPAPVTTASTGNVGVVCFVPPATSTVNPNLECPQVQLEQMDPRSLIDALAAGPDNAQRNAGLTTQVPQNTTLLDAELDGSTNILTINLSSSINNVSSPNNTLAYRQIVETLTNPANRLGADAVRVRVDGKDTKIPTDAGPLPVATDRDFGAAAAQSPPTASQNG